MVVNPTHRVVITITSSENGPDVNMQVNWDPLLGDDEIEQMGYEPAAYTVARNMLFSIEQLASMANLLELEEGDLDAARSIN